MTTTETAEVLQQEIEEAKSRLSAKIDTLEQQYNVVENVQQAGTAVAATVEAVQATAHAVNEAVETLHSAVDVESHIRKHPWLCMGGSVALGYLATTWWSRRQAASAKSPMTSLGDFPSVPPSNEAQFEPSAISQAAAVAFEPFAAESPASVANRAYQQAMLQSSPAYNLKILAMNTLMGVIREAAARAVPKIADYLMAHVEDSSAEPHLTNSSQPR